MHGTPAAHRIRRRGLSSNSPAPRGVYLPGDGVFLRVPEHGPALLSAAASLPVAVCLTRVLNGLLGVSTAEGIGLLPMLSSSFPALSTQPVCLDHLARGQMPSRRGNSRCGRNRNDS